MVGVTITKPITQLSRQTSLWIVHRGNKGYAIQVYQLPAKITFAWMIQWVDHPMQSFILHWVTVRPISFKAKNFGPPITIRSRSQDSQSLFTSFNTRSWHCERQAKNLMHIFFQLRLVKNVLREIIHFDYNVISTTM